MKILFVCESNVGRSQMAEAIFNKISKKHTSISAGVRPRKWKGKNLSETKHIAFCMKEIGYDVRKKISKKLTKKMVDGADKIVIMVERELWPKYLKKSNKVIFWNVKDPGGKDRKFNRKTRDKIAKLVKKLIKDIG